MLTGLHTMGVATAGITGLLAEEAASGVTENAVLTGATVASGVHSILRRTKRISGRGNRNGNLGTCWNGGIRRLHRGFPNTSPPSSAYTGEIACYYA